jgi:hypothetical protein
MSDRHTPDSLADALDAHLPPGHPGTTSPASGDPLVDAAARLAQAAPPRLSPDALQRIEARVMQAQPVPQPVIRLPYLVTAAAAIVVAVIAGAVLITLGQTPQQTEVAVIATDAATETPTVTPSSTPTPPPTDAPTEAPALIATDAPTDLPADLPASATPAPTETDTLTPSSIPPSATPAPPTPAPPAYDGVVVRLQGPVSAVTVETATVTVFDTFEVRLAADDPLLRVLRVGDRVRLEGTLTRVGDRLDIAVDNIQLDNPDDADNVVETGPEPGDIWRDDGTCANAPPPWAVAGGWRARCESGDSQPGNPQHVPPGQQDNPNSNRPDSPPGQSDNPGRGNPPDSPPGQANNPGQGNKPDAPPGQANNPGQGNKPDAPPGQANNPPGQNK